MNASCRLYAFDQLVCDQIQRVLCHHLEDRRFRDGLGAVASRLFDIEQSEPLSDCAQGGESQRMFTGEELYELQVRLTALPMRLTKHWIWSPSIGRQAVRCVPEINNHFSPLQGRRWDEASADFDGRLRRRNLHLDDAIEVVGEWLGVVREYLNALGPDEFAPLPDGVLSTSTVRPAGMSINEQPQPPSRTVIPVFTQPTGSRDVVDSSWLESASKLSSMSPPQIAKRFGVSPDKVLTWIRSGELVAVNVATRPGGRPRYTISADSLAQFEKRRGTSKAPRANRRAQQPVADVTAYF